jgi:hypothetical protein
MAESASCAKSRHDRDIKLQRRLRPIAHRTDYFQRMLDEVVELAQMAEELGLEAVAFPVEAL